MTWADRLFRSKHQSDRYNPQALSRRGRFLPRGAALRSQHESSTQIISRTRACGLPPPPPPPPRLSTSQSTSRPPRFPTFQPASQQRGTTLIVSGERSALLGFVGEPAHLRVTSQQVLAWVERSQTDNVTATKAAQAATEASYLAAEEARKHNTFLCTKPTRLEQVLDGSLDDVNQEKVG